MEKPNIKQAVESMIATTRAYVTKAIAPVNERIDDLAKRIGLIDAGPRGEVGAQGVDGPGGPEGEPGAKGDDGEQGARGEQGEQGSIGGRGEIGAQGAQGAAGEHGEAGPVGLEGKQGERGAGGRDAAEIDILPSLDETKAYRRGTWASHNNGLMVATRETDPLDTLSLSSDVGDLGWRVVVEGLAAIVTKQDDDDPRKFAVSCMMTSGTAIVTEFAIPAMIYKDIWTEGEYQKGDVVTWSGSSWHCQLDGATGKPGASDDWRLMTKRGADATNKKASASPYEPRKPVRIK